MDNEEPAGKEESSAVRTGRRRDSSFAGPSRPAGRGDGRKFPAEEKIHILLEGVRGEVPVVELCRGSLSL